MSTVFTLVNVNYRFKLTSVAIFIERFFETVPRFYGVPVWQVIVRVR